MYPADKNKAHRNVPGAAPPAALGTPPDLHGASFECPLCRSTEYLAAAHSVSGRPPLTVYKCAGCALSFVHPERFAKS